MSRVTASFKANTIADLTAAVNAYLLPFTGGSSRNIIWVDVILNYYPRQFTKEFQCSITTDTVATAPATSPFVMVMFDEKSVTDLNAALVTYYAANVGEFTTGMRIVSQDTSRSLNQMIGWLLNNATLADGGNYTPK
jgi:hypothetical protein